MKLSLLTFVFMLGCSAVQNAAADPTPLLSNGGFESGMQGWGIFVPEESKPSNCRADIATDTPHSGSNCLRLQADDFGRFCVGGGLIPVQPGEHYHVSVWYHAPATAEVRPKALGFVIRLFLSQAGADAQGGHLFIAPGNRVTREAPADPKSDTLPTTWTQIEAVVEIPPGVDAMGPSLFSWWTKGTVYADDFSIEKVDASTPATAVWHKDGTPAAK